MLEITISEDITTVENTVKKCVWNINTSEFFGNVYYILEEYFPILSPDSVEAKIKDRFIKMLNGKPVDEPITVFGCTELGSTLLNLRSYIDDNTLHDIGLNRAYILPTLKDLEEFRIVNRMTSNYLPASFDEHKGIRYTKLNTVTQVLIAALYFYAFNDYKLAKCQHCGKWYATKTLKKKYCDRISPCFGIIVKGKEPLSCEQAVRNILQKCGRIRNRIENKTRQTLAAQQYKSVFQNEFSLQCELLYLSAKNEPTVENLTKYHHFLETTEKGRGWTNNG